MDHNKEKSNNKNQNLTDLSSLGEFGFIEHIRKNIKKYNNSTIVGIGDDSAVLKIPNLHSLISTDMLVEGVHFDLSYFPLKHLGYKAVVCNISDICAMNGTCKQITVSVAVSNRFKLESLDELYDGINLACKRYQVDLVGGDTTSSQKGLIISVTSIGVVDQKKICKRSGANNNDLIVCSGKLGLAYLGLQILEREKQVFLVNPNSKPDLEPYKELVERQLKPEARTDLINFLDKNSITPTSMIDISDGLSSEIIHLCNNSEKGCVLYSDKIYKDQSLLKACNEFNLDPISVIMSGGEDYEILFTINSSDYEKIENSDFDLHVIGHITNDKKTYLDLDNGSKAEIKSLGWKSF